MQPQLLTVIELEKLKTWTPDEWKKWWIEPKYDGARCIYHKGQFLSRTGKPFHNLDHIAAELSRLDGWTLDGEIYGPDWADTMSVARSSKTKKDGRGLKYAVFDCMTDQEWEKGNPSNTLWARRELIADLLRTTHVHVVPHYEGHSYIDFNFLHTNHLLSGCDGTVLKLKDSSYEFKRTRTWLKVKPVETFDGKVCGMYEGKGKYVGMLGGLEVEFDNVITNVSGMDDECRYVWWQSPSWIIGKTIEVAARGKHPSGCLIEPRFIRIREDK